MVKEFIKLQAGAAPGPVTSPVSSLEAPQLELRGPTGGVEGEDQGHQPISTPGKMAGGEDHNFPLPPPKSSVSCSDTHSGPVSSLEAPQLELRGPAGWVEGEDQGHQPVLTPGKVAGSVPFYLSSLEAPQLEVRGPAVRVEGEVQGQHTPRPQAPCSMPAEVNFPSLDIRFKEEPPSVLYTGDKRSASTIVDDLTPFCRQKKSGIYQPPAFTEVSFCVLCQKGATCIGICCQGPMKPPKSSGLKIIPPSSIIPGLNGNIKLTSLSKPTKTSRKRKHVQYFSISKIYQWSKPKPVATQNRTVEPKLTAAPTKKPSKRQRISQDAVYDSEKLKKILLHSSLNPKSTTKSSSSKGFGRGKQVTSMYRKLSIGEERCSRKIHPVTNHHLLTKNVHKHLFNDSLPHFSTSSDALLADHLPSSFSFPVPRHSLSILSPPPVVLLVSQSKDLGVEGSGQVINIEEGNASSIFHPEAESRIKSGEKRTLVQTHLEVNREMREEDKKSVMLDGDDHNFPGIDIFSQSFNSY